MLLVIALVVSVSRVAAMRASESDMGRLVYRGPENGTGPHVYVSKDTTAIDKIHFLISLPQCECIAMADAQKINQLDFMLSADHLFSFAAYVNAGGLADRRECDISAADMHRRTDLLVNVLPPSVGAARSNSSFFEDRIEGHVLYHGMADFYSNAYIDANHGEIFGTDKSGGVLFTQGTVEFRTCRLVPWYEPWIYNDGNTEIVLDYAKPHDDYVCYSEEMAAVFVSILAKMHREGAFKAKHVSNLEDNNHDTRNTVRAFPFQALFVPHRYGQEFVKMLRYFKDSGLCAHVYVPFVFQSLFDRNEWLYLTQEQHNQTLRVSDAPLLASCVADTVDDMNVDNRVVRSMYWYNYGECGGGWVIAIEYIMRTVVLSTGDNYILVICVLVLALCVLAGFAFRETLRTGCMLLYAKMRALSGADGGMGTEMSTWTGADPYNDSSSSSSGGSNSLIIMQTPANPSDPNHFA
jgi:hypothetical protein